MRSNPKRICPSKGEFSYPIENLSILDLSGTQFTFCKSVQGGTFELTNCVLAHSNFTGQISGMGEGAMRGILRRVRISFGQEIFPEIFFTAEPLKRGSIVTVSGAKLTSYSTGSGYLASYGDISFNFISICGLLIYSYALREKRGGIDDGSAFLKSLKHKIPFAENKLPLTQLYANVQYWPQA